MESPSATAHGWHGLVIARSFLAARRTNADGGDEDEDEGEERVLDAAVPRVQEGAGQGDALDALVAAGEMRLSLVRLQELREEGMLTPVMHSASEHWCGAHRAPRGPASASGLNQKALGAR